MKLYILFLSVIIFPAFAYASEEVHFNSASVPLSPFKIKQAKAKGIELEPNLGVEIIGKLSKPEGAGSFPAVILLHSCFGIRPYQDRWAAKLAQWGYVSLQVDRFSPRDIDETCTDIAVVYYSLTYPTLFDDVYGALSYLRVQPFVDKDRVAVMGWGWSNVLSIIYREGRQQYYDEKFHAAIGIYPDCRLLSSGDFYVPLMIHIGANDDWMKVSSCEQIAEASGVLPNPIELHVYPDTLHGFDDADVGQRRHYAKVLNHLNNPALGATLGYNADAHHSAEEHVRVFLGKHLK